MEYGSNAVNFNQKYNYVLQWLQESTFARQMYQQYCYRVNLAMEGKPWKNTYAEEMNSNLEKMNAEQSAAYKAQCTKIPEGTSLKLYNSVETIANQMAAGVESYECQLWDPYMVQEADTEDKLIAMCEQDYIENSLNLYAPQFSRDLTSYGLVAVMVKYNQETEKNEVYRINPKNTWWDTMYSATGHERFRGYSTMISWDTLKNLIKQNKDEINTDIQAPKKSIFDEDGKINKVEKARYSHGKIRSLNGLDIYVKDLNKLAASPQLQGGDFNWWEYTHDLRSCYNLNYYRSFATTPEARTNSGYNGQDVELTVIYDLERGIEFKVINRRFVISMNKNVFERKLIFKVYDPLANENRFRLDTFHAKCPLQFQFAHINTMDKNPFPTSPLFNLLDTHDTLCGWRAKREHVAQILAILRLVANGTDAENLRGVLNIMGVVIDTIQGDISTIDLNYHFDPIDSQIAHYEETIQTTLSAYTQFDAMQTMGDRATAAESGMAGQAIAQGVTAHQNIIMALYADIARQCIINRVTYSNLREFPIVNNGKYSVLTIQEMALLTLIKVEPKFAKKVMERTMAANALAILGSFKDTLPPEALAFFMKQAMLGNVPRKLAETFVTPGPSAEEQALATLQAQNQATQLLQNQQLFEQNPIPYATDEIMANNTSQDVDQIISQLRTPKGTETTDIISSTATPQVLDSTNQEGSLMLNMEGQTSDLGSQLANTNTLLG